MLSAKKPETLPSETATSSAVPSRAITLTANRAAVLKDYAAGSLGEAQTMTGHSSTVYCLRLLPDGRLASGSCDTTIKIWNVAEQRCEVTLTEHTDSVNCLIVLPDGRLASGSVDRTIKIWNVGQQRCEATLTGRKLVECLTVLLDGRLASGSSDSTIKIWDFPTLSPATLVSLAAAVVIRGCANTTAADILSSNSDVISSSSDSSKKHTAVSSTVRQLFFQPPPAEEPIQEPIAAHPSQSKTVVKNTVW